jgi:dipeptidyl aminopeptidase/acylaminoacyl peptidase
MIKNRRIEVLVLIGFVYQVASLSGLAQKRPMQIEDFFSLKEVVDLQLSPLGDEVLYVLEQADLKTDRLVRTIWCARVDGETAPVKLTDDKDVSPGRFGPAGNIVRWSPDGKRVAFLSSHSGSSQVWLLTLSTGKVEQATDLPTGVISFEWSPDGRFLAFTAPDKTKSQALNAKPDPAHGIVIEKLNYSIFKLLGSQPHIQLDIPSRLWLLEVNSHKVEEAFGEGDIAGFIWSPDSQAIAITRIISSIPPGGSDVVIYSLEEHGSVIALQGKYGRSFDDISSYSAEAWSPDNQQLAVTVRHAKDRWQSIPRVGIYNIVDRKLSLITDDAAFEPFVPVFHWNEKHQLYLENSHKTNRGLFVLSTAGSKVDPTVNGDGYASNFSFAHDGRTVAFVKQDLQHPPEIYVSTYPFKSTARLTLFNDYISDIRLPKTEVVRWMSLDGTTIEGLLFLPVDYEQGKKYPLLVVLHGGPGLPMSNRFEPYKLFTGLLAPYPIHMFAEHGFAVLLPNYRGTGAYGKAFKTPTEQDKEPVEDVMSGINFMVKKGIADQERLGIIGHSHGSWLGALIATKERYFKAASVFEGWSDSLSQYGQMIGWLDLNVFEYYDGGTPYDNPKRYIELSPIFHTKGLNTATLVESGQLSLAAQGLEFTTALWRNGVPHESVIYPKTGHNLERPQLMLDSANRNLDWFEYWILGRKNDDPAKREQYERWEKMKGEMARMRMLKPVVQSP